MSCKTLPLDPGAACLSLTGMADNLGKESQKPTRRNLQAKEASHGGNLAACSHEWQGEHDLVNLWGKFLSNRNLSPVSQLDVAAIA